MANKPKQITFITAAKTVVPFGPFEGKTLDVIAREDDGLRYLDNLRGKIQGVSYFNLCLEAYLDSHVIAKALEDLMEARHQRYASSG